MTSRLLSEATLALTMTLALAVPVAAAQAQTAPTQLPPVPVDTTGGIQWPLSSSTPSDDALAAKRLSTSDTAALLNDLPGMSSATGGGVSSLPVVHGMADDRNKIVVDGMSITSSCPNHMNPAMSYIDPSTVAKASVVAGLTPVSQGGDSIGGTVAVDSAPPVFAAPGENLHTVGSLSAFFRSNNNDVGGSADISVANGNFSLDYTGSGDRARNYHDGNGQIIVGSGHDTTNHAATLAARNDTTLVAIKGGEQFTPFEGFPNQYMDLTGNRAYFFNARLQGDYGWGSLDARVYWLSTLHAMNNPDDKSAVMPMPMFTDGTDVGYSV
ncbi:MAG: TonB-dependent receptor plug domain-containing protein, partial [Alphaproteobacteria bacterium]|nr:TonB-dependent receptor plug domain-containing protein [Alphaproteobacteria bacterium]